MAFKFNPLGPPFDLVTTPGGSDTYVQYNDAGSFGGDANNTWNKTTKLATYTKSNLTTTVSSSVLMRTETAATTSVRIQNSPAIQFRANGWRTTGAGSNRTVDFYEYGVPSTGTNEVVGEWRLDYSLNGATASRGLQYATNVSDGVAAQQLTVNGFVKSIANNSSTIDTLQNFNLVNTSGTRTHITATFGSTIKWGIQVQSDGLAYYKSAGTSQGHYFQVGSAIGSTSDIVQIYSGGIYNYGGMFATGKVTAGSPDTNAKSYLNTYAGFSSKVKIIETTSYTVDNSAMLWLVNPINALCTGTATPCSNWTASGEATCNSHSTIGCSWTAEVTGNCSTANGTDSGTCTGLNAACVWESASCATAGNNTDQTTCEDQDNIYGGTCAWDTTTCPAFTSTAACNGQAGCTATVTGDCTTLSDGGGDGTNCATQPECSYDNGTGACTGSFFTSCAGNLCNGTFDTGNCTGTYTITPAFCGGTASCANMTASGSSACTAESPCTWATGADITLPLNTNANTGTSGNVSHEHSFVHVGDSGTATITANTGSSIMQYSNLKLYKKGDKVTVQHVYQTANCSVFVSEGTCTSTGCTWNPAVVCSDYNSQEANCLAAGCSYSDPNCTGAGTAANCSGTYTAQDMWVPINYDRSTNYVEKTAAYTITNEDDTVVWTSGTVNATLPLSADIVPRRPIYLKNRGTGVITLVTTSSQLIDGNASGTLVLNTDDAIELFPLAAGWVIL
jgi:hypothetical protein